MADITQEQLDKAVRDAVEAAVGPLNTSITKLETNNAALVEEKKTAKIAADAKTAEAVAAAEEAARKSGDVEALEKSWGDKYAKLQETTSATSASNLAVINDLTAGATRKDIAASMALKGSEGIFEQIIANRIGVEMRDGKPITVVMDKSGKPSAATLDEFKKELSEDAALKPLLAGSKGSGGGGVDPNASGGTSKTITRAEYDAIAPNAQREAGMSGAKFIDE